MKAVDAWRSRGNPVKSPQKPVPIPVGPPGPSGASKSALAMAAKIAGELEQEQREFNEKMRREKENLQASFKINEELKMKVKGEEKESKDGIFLSEEKHQNSSCENTNDRYHERIIERTARGSSEKNYPNDISHEAKGLEGKSESKYGTVRTGIDNEMVSVSESRGECV